jgi:hypothetical protein
LYSDEPIGFVLRQAENRTTVGRFSVTCGVGGDVLPVEQPFAGMEVVEIRRLNQLEEENAKH